MLHIQVPVCYRCHMHVSMLAAQGSSSEPVEKDFCLACSPGYISWGGGWGGLDGWWGRCGWVVGWVRVGPCMCACSMHTSAVHPPLPVLPPKSVSCAATACIVCFKLFTGLQLPTCDCDSNVQLLSPIPFSGLLCASTNFSISTVC